MGNDNPTIDFNASSIIKYIISKIKILALITLIAAVLAAVASLFIHDKYKAEVVMFPATQASISQSLVDPNYNNTKSEYLGVGTDEDVDKLLQILNSETIKYELINKFNLSEHYGINLATKGAQSKLLKTLGGSMNCSRTEYNSVVISVIDENPQLASNMANEISSLADSVNNRMIRDKVMKSYQIIKSEHDSLSLRLKVILDSLTRLNKLGIVDYQFQSQELTKAYYNALAAGKSDLVTILEKKLKIFESYGATANLLTLELGYKEGFISSLNQKLTIARVAMNNKISSKYIVNSAKVPDSKDSPKRTIIVLISAIAAFFVSLISFILIDNFKKILQ